MAYLQLPYYVGLLSAAAVPPDGARAIVSALEVLGQYHRLFFARLLQPSPGEPMAADAYALLDEFLVSGYSGSGGTHVPPDIQAKLDELQKIAESQTPSS